MSTTNFAGRPAQKADSTEPAAMSEVDPLADIITGTSTAVLSRRSAGGFRAPLWRLVITSDFGERLHPVLGTRRFHRGVDYGARNGTPVRSVSGGTIVWAGEVGPYGNLVVIEHETDLHTAYGHLESINVAVAQQIRAGQRIGRVGSTGMATGPHLHFEVRDSGTPIDPTAWIDQQPGPIVAALDALEARIGHSRQCSLPGGRATPSP